jgi:hypothetical protein
MAADVTFPSRETREPLEHAITECALINRCPLSAEIAAVEQRADAAGNTIYKVRGVSAISLPARLDYFASQASPALSRVFTATVSLWFDVSAPAFTRVFTATAC